MGWRVGIDIGGTFTDVVAVEGDSGRRWLGKAPSTPANLTDGAMAGLAGLARVAALSEVSFFAHGTTAGTNALLEGKGARTGLVTTEGFRDLLEIARQQRPSLYDLSARKPRPLAPRRLRREVPERMRYDGSVMRPLDREAAARELRLLADEGIEALAICFLHSYANPSHELAVKGLAERLLPGVYVTASCELLPRFREYERLSTTVVNAYLGPLMSRYLDGFRGRAAGAGVGAVPHIVQSNGGLASLGEARRKPASTVLSGPAAGAGAAAALCEELGIRRAIAMDMGGTSTDLCVIEGGLPASGSGREVGGYAVDLPGVDVRCVGAGGGSILWIDGSGLPQVGPRSAGAEPGPVCYGKGGEEATLTDAFVALGRVAPRGLLGGEMAMDLDGARRAVARGFGERLGVEPGRAALGAVELAVANVRHAIEGITVARGRDPREYALVAAGGAGPLIGCEVAGELGIEEVIVPAWPGSFSAGGLVVCDLRRDWVETRLLPAAPERLGELNEAFGALEGAAARWVEETGLGDMRWRVVRQCYARYVGQDYELPIPVGDGELGEQELSDLVARFHAVHDEHYGYALPGNRVELVDLGVSAVGRAARPAALRKADRGGAMREAEERRPIVVDESAGVQGCAAYAREELRPGDVVRGPAAIDQYDSTTYLPPGCRAMVDGSGNLCVRREGR